MESDELKFILRLLDCRDYRSPLSATAFQFLRKSPSVQLLPPLAADSILHGDSGFGKSHLLGRLKQTLNPKAFFTYVAVGLIATSFGDISYVKMKTI